MLQPKSVCKVYKVIIWEFIGFQNVYFFLKKEVVFKQNIGNISKMCEFNNIPLKLSMW